MEGIYVAGDFGVDFPTDTASIAIGEDNEKINNMKEDCVSTSYLMYLAAPFVITVILYFWSPDFVIKRTYSGTKKVVLPTFLKWIGIFTIGLWIVIYIGVKTGAIQKNAEVCARRES